MSNNNSETQINNLFTQLESVTKWSHSLNIRSLFGAEDMRDACSTVFGESLDDITKIQVRIVRTLLRAGLIGELECHIEVGTLNKHIIQVACGRKPWKGVAA